MPDHILAPITSVIGNLCLLALRFNLPAEATKYSNFVHKWHSKCNVREAVLASLFPMSPRPSVVAQAPNFSRVLEMLGFGCLHIL